MFGKRLFYFVLVLSMFLVTLFSGTRVSAGPDRVTNGDVEAALRSWNTGFRAIFFISNSVAAAPLDAFQRARISPGSDGVHYCVEDWHFVHIAWITGGDESFTRDDAVAELAFIENTFILDGAVLPIQKTPVVRRVVSLFFDVDYGISVGSILAPEDLGVGEHTLTFVFSFPDGFTETSTITFYVDPSGSGACLQ
jgi:hypothetical protein